MKRLAAVFGGLAIAALVGLVAFLAIGGVTPRYVLAVLFVDAEVLVKLGDMILVLLLLVVGIVCLIRPRNAAANWGGAPFLKVMAWIAPLLGVLVGLNGGLLVISPAVRLHVTHLAVVAPYLAAALLPIALAFAIGAIAAAVVASRPAAVVSA